MNRRFRCVLVAACVCLNLLLLYAAARDLFARGGGIHGLEATLILLIVAPALNAMACLGTLAFISQQRAVRQRPTPSYGWVFVPLTAFLLLEIAIVAIWPEPNGGPPFSGIH